MDFTLLFMYFITVNKHRFCISVIGYINMQIIGICIGYKKSISVDHYFLQSIYNINVVCINIIYTCVHLYKHNIHTDILFLLNHLTALIQSIFISLA